jgi:hypothetical protein
MDDFEAFDLSGDGGGPSPPPGEAQPRLPGRSRWPATAKFDLNGEPVQALDLEHPDVVPEARRRIGDRFHHAVLIVLIGLAMGGGGAFTCALCLSQSLVQVKELALAVIGLGMGAAARVAGVVLGRQG